MNNKKSPNEIAKKLSKLYGNTFDEIIYTKGVGISGKIRFAELSRDKEKILEEVNKTISKQKNTIINEQYPGQFFSGYVWAEDLYRVKNEKKHMEILVEFAKKHYKTSNSTLPNACDPTYRSEDIFFTSAIMGRVYKYTKNSDYSNILSKYLLNIPTQKKDGLFMHNLDAEWNWGRSNGFAALGFTEAISYLPDNKEKNKLISIHINHLDALIQLQNNDGTWSQVLNEKSSYHEFSVTCMIAYCISKGIRLGWLDSSYSSVLDIAFNGISSMIDDIGNIKKVCIGTGVQNTLRDYLNRPAISGFDHRGGSLCLWFMTEYMLQYKH